MSAALAAQRPDDCIILRYEDLCDDPATQIVRIGRWAGLMPRPEPLAVPAWCADLSAAALYRASEPITLGAAHAQLAERFGYFG